jgi:SAM-dependent methyltransferase
VLARPWFDDAYQQLVEDYAATTAERFDVALAVYVVEHVDHPDAFLRAVRSLLRPDGSCFGITPNLWHYFGLISAAASRLGFEDWLLHRVRAAELIEAYHSPVRYRLNSLRRIRTVAQGAGFRHVEFRAIEQAGMFETYFPAQLQRWPRRYSALINRLGHPELFGTLFFRLVA